MANLLEYSSFVFVDCKFIFYKWTLKICLLPSRSGRFISISLSNLPGLIRALSNKFWRLVAAITITLLSVPKPSISTKIWFKVLSLSSCDPCDPLLFLPTASISSMKMIEGAFYRARANKSLTLEAPTPTKISTKSDPEVGIKGTPASPAQAFPNKVFPVPGGPDSRTPLGILAPSFLYFSGFFKKSTNYLISSLL